MNKKRLIAFAMAGLMTMSVALTGCGSKGEEKKDTAKDGEVVTVTWCVYGDKKEDLDKVIDDLNEKIEEKINVRLNLDVIPQGEFSDKMKLKSTAGEDYDMVFTSNWLNQFSENMSREAFLPLDDYMQFRTSRSRQDSLVLQFRKNMQINMDLIKLL